MSLLWFPLTRNVSFKTAPQFGSDWLVIFLLALAPVSLVEIAKIIRGRHRRKDHTMAESSWWWRGIRRTPPVLQE